LHVSDFDYDGEQVIGPTFAQQARRYVDNVLEARIGVDPKNLIDAGYQLNDKWYQIKISNKAYKEWADVKAIGIAVCETCQEAKVINNMQDSIRHCESCGAESSVIVQSDNYYGFEVEAMKTREYYMLVVDALLKVLPFDYIIKRLREECTADPYRAAESLRNSILDDNENYQEVLEQLAEYEELLKKKEEFENDVEEEIRELAVEHISDWEDQEEDPEVQQYRNHVFNAQSYTGPWRPFDQSLRTSLLIDFMGEEYSDEFEEMKARIV
jgi:hypothetical protein